MVSRNLRGLVALSLLAPALPLVAATAATAAPPPDRPRHHPRAFDVQAHRGGLGLTTESSLAGFTRALELGVSTLELDVQVTEDGQAVVTHDRRTNPQVCRDTAPAEPGDPEFPYVGRYVNTLSLAQLRTLDCGSVQKPGYPQQQTVPGSRMTLLSEVLDLVQAYDADDVDLNVEPKVEAGAPSETAPREQFVQVVAEEVREAGIADQVTIQSFDWGVLRRMQQVFPQLPTIALTNHDFLQVGRPGASPWLGGLDADDFGGDLVAMATELGVEAISPVHGFPQDGAVGDADYTPYVDRRMVRDAHRAGLEVVPWTVDDPETMRRLVRLGVDGLITDHPDRLRTVLRQEHRRLPAPVRVPRQARPLAQAHAHNDYEHDRPLLDALDQGFTSVEADVWLVDGELLVAHDLEDVQPGRTLERLYLSPLSARVAMNRGSVLPGSDRPLQLLIDVKSEASATWRAVDRALRNHPGLLTRSTPSTTTPGAVTAVISGNRDLPAMAAQADRRAGYDARSTDLGGPLPAAVAPLVSENWTKLFSWLGDGTMPAAERARLRAYVDTAHARGQRVRFWATPDTPGPARDAVWSELLAAGVDHVNTDDLPGLRRFLDRRR
ncbi:glycerophosphodiester phosphodiesterase family protein [Nocardioides litoris]|uniref:glycerophosphodiester phosphodiesterase family protein n=1 Tax=Nocardioides litoris TaxID=1926648 RepID=UPI0011203039|nr:glycerophosphodiester phosphodiesterase family protein [Nocardioides litoris]